MVEKIYVNTDDVHITNEDRESVERVRKDIYNSLNGEEAEVAICIWMYTAKRLDKLNNCIDSLMKYTNHIKFKLVLANNGGGDEVEKYYENIDYPDKMIIDISKNIGSPHGASVITKYVKNKYIVELLNDCVVTYNWLDNMLHCIKSDDRIGMVVPMSTNVANMQIPDTGNLDLSNVEEIQKFARYYNNSNPLKWEERIRLMPIVGLYKREALEMAGMADPGYLHEYADDDHCIRIRRAGYKLVLCGDTFVHHDHYEHSMPKNTTQIENHNVEMGRRGFMKKFNGLDPWFDFMNVVSPYISNIDIKDSKNQYKLLGIDVKCGTPILDMKNCYRRSGINLEKLNITSYIQDIKYYTDLVTVSDEVIHDDIHNIKNHMQGEYDFIVLGNILNSYYNSLDILKRLINMLSEGGYLLVQLKNLNDISALSTILGEKRSVFEEKVENIYYNDVVYCANLHGISDIKLYTENYADSLGIENIGKSMLKLGVVAEENKDVIEQWKVKNYWFLFHK